MRDRIRIVWWIERLVSEAIRARVLNARHGRMLAALSAASDGVFGWFAALSAAAWGRGDHVLKVRPRLPLSFLILTPPYPFFILSLG